ncbi:MAG: metallophosphoesterase [Ruminococcaceae bacterium]|nr:metallophosphoesterase [Oscillospiraceae bacterium]
MLRLFGKLMQMIVTLVLVLMLAGAGVFAYARWIEPRRLAVTQETICSPRVTDASDGLKIVQFSDIHICDDDDSGKLMRIVSAINAQKPDIVVFTGDLFDNFPAYEGTIESIPAAFSQIKARYGKYAVLGNHDYEVSALPKVREIWSDSGFELLQDDRVNLTEQGLCIVGMDDWLFGSCETTCLDQADADAFTLLLCHEPDVADRLDKESFDLMLSGHTHGGQIKLPVLGIVYTPPLGRVYEEGRYELGGKRDAVLYVNRGTGQSLLPIRFMTVPEITVLTLKSQ